MDHRIAFEDVLHLRSHLREAVWRRIVRTGQQGLRRLRQQTGVNQHLDDFCRRDGIRRLP